MLRECRDGRPPLAASTRSCRAFARLARRSRLASRNPGASFSYRRSLEQSPKSPGAGSDEVNGQYAVDGAYKGQALYTNKETGLQIWWNGQWRLGKTNDYYYQLDAGEQSVFGSPGEEDGSWEVATFQPHEGTCGPAPNLSVYSQTCP